MRIACLFRGGLRDEDRDKDKFELVIKSIYNLFDTKDITFFIHLWSKNKEYDLYNRFFDKDKIILENNADHFNSIIEVYSRYVDRKDFSEWERDRLFAQISSCLSLQKVSELFFDRSKINNYDFVFITRPDLVFCEKINKLEIDEDTIHVNIHPPYNFMGESCFVSSVSNVRLFENMFRFLFNNENLLIPKLHRWYYQYLTDICKKEVELLNIEMGLNCEIRHHLSLDRFKHILEKAEKFN